VRFLADMGISQSTVSWLRGKGHNVTHLREEELHRMSDAEITEKGRKEERIILTCDLDFGDIMAASGGICPSIIIFRLEDQRPRNVNRRLAQVLGESSDLMFNSLCESAH